MKTKRCARAAVLLALFLGACAAPPTTTPKPDAKSVPDAATLGKAGARVTLDTYFSVDYEIETKRSTVDNKSCYSFITGTLNNHSPRTLARSSVLDFIVVHNGTQLFRDLTSPRADVPPGGKAMFDMIVSPVHKDSCPKYDRIDISLRKTYQN